MICCNEVTTPFCPNCGAEQTVGASLLAHVRRSRENLAAQVSNRESSMKRDKAGSHDVARGEESLARTRRKARKWADWAAWIEAAINREQDGAGDDDG